MLPDGGRDTSKLALAPHFKMEVALNSRLEGFRDTEAVARKRYPVESEAESLSMAGIYSAGNIFKISALILLALVAPFEKNNDTVILSRD